ncbi:MAG TPA: sensor histidine kinase [Pyrinomonadaceae bacterium]|jgi:signal transduction histidine kinase
MSKQNEQLGFEASAYIQRLIGRELISTEELAIIEFVKNAYDAGATRVVITIQAQSKHEPGEITIRDNGSGMTIDSLKRIFMFAGYSERPNEVNTSPRVPTGEKGIGRFAADKLGHELLVITKSQGSKESLCVDINWDAFDNRKSKFSDIKFPLTYRLATELADVDSGTFLRISRLRMQWTKARIEALHRSLADLLDPFNPPSDFEIDLQIPSSLELTGLITPPPVMRPDIKLYFKIENVGKVKRTIVAPSLKTKKETSTTTSVAAAKELRGLEGRLHYFLKRPNKTERKGLFPGVRLYRDGFRVEPFGRTYDWLGVAEKKAKRAGHAHIVPSHLFGFISTYRRKNPDIRHTTSRETFLEGETVQSMLRFLREQLEFLEGNIKTEVTEPRWKESREQQAREQARELERGRFQTLSIMSMGLAHELRQPLQAIRAEAENIRDRLQQLNIDDEDIGEAQKSIDENVTRIDSNIRAIAAISTGSPEAIETTDLAKFVREQCEILLRPRCNSAGVNLVLQLPRTQQARINKMTVTTLLANLVQNALDALEAHNGGETKEIKVTLSKSNDVHILNVIDNGPGIDDETRPKIFQQFTSKKTGGWGIGLSTCSSLVKLHEGKIEFTSRTGLGTSFHIELPDAS